MHVKIHREISVSIGLVLTTVPIFQLRCNDIEGAHHTDRFKEG